MKDKHMTRGTVDHVHLVKFKKVAIGIMNRAINLEECTIELDANTWADLAGELLETSELLIGASELAVAFAQDAISIGTTLGYIESDLEAIEGEVITGRIEKFEKSDDISEKNLS
jgi:hypothetical protein